jgi:DNA-binding MarR family transcriptional regulator
MNKFRPDFRVDLPLTTSRPELLSDGGDESFRTFVHDLLAFGGRLREVRDSLASLVGLSGPSYTILISIARLGARDEVRVTSLVHHLNVSQPFVSAEVHKLVAAGLVDKAPSVTDGRSVSLSVTAAGRERLESLAPQQREINDLVFRGLTATVFGDMRHAVARLVEDAGRGLELAEELKARKGRKGMVA